MTIGANLVLILTLTLINAFFASAEMAIVSINKNKIKMLADKGNKNAKSVEKLIQEPTKFLSTIQVGITLAGLFSSAYAATGISDDFAALLDIVHIPYSQNIALILVTVLLSYFTLVFGELFPKRLALKKSEAIALFSVKPIIVVQKIVTPFIKLLSVSTNLLLRLFGIREDDLEEKVSREEIRSLVEVAQEHGTINLTERRMINSIFELDDKPAEEIMTPRTEAYVINVEKNIKEYLPDLLHIKHSRIPVFEGTRDNIIGILYMKDFIEEAFKVGFDQVEIKKLLCPAYFVPERKRIDDLFKEMQEGKKKISILVDEYGGFSGIVTMEDLIEEIVGEIDDEYDLKDEPDIRKIAENTYLIRGSVPVEVVNERLLLNFEVETEDYDTIAGMIINMLGHIPSEEVQQSIKVENCEFTIEKITNNRIVQVKLKILGDSNK
jgi:putative hemolysin